MGTEYDASSILAMAYAPSVSATTPSGVTIRHSRLKLQLMASQRF